MLATLTDAPFDDPRWVFEDKYDGFRTSAEIKNGNVALYSATARSSAAATSRSPRLWKELGPTP